MLFNVALLSPPFATLTYAAPDWLPGFAWMAGMRVAVPLGQTMTRAGVIVGGGDGRTDLPEGVVLRSMLWPMETVPLLSEEYIHMIQQLAARQALTPGKILSSVLPRGLRSLMRYKLRNYNMGRKPGQHTLSELGKLPLEELRKLGRDFVSGQNLLVQSREAADETEVCLLTGPPPWPLRPNAGKQRAVLECLLEKGPLTVRRLKDTFPGGSPTVQALLKVGLIVIKPLADADAGEESVQNLPPPAAAGFALSPEQQTALSLLNEALENKKSSTHLLYGVTGSGKTAVYLELAQLCLDRNLSCLVLAPELALALKLRRDFIQRFPSAQSFFFHGYQSPLQREKTFRSLAAQKTPCLIIGTRSALFLPMPPLGAIVLDEEHDASFKQDEGFNYQAKEVAWQRAVTHNALLLLGSATPDIKTFYSASTGAMPVHRLPRRMGGADLPDIELVNIKENTGTLLTPDSLNALAETLTRGEQAVVLLNRRGYAPLMFCLDCGQALKCPHCDIGLTYHKNREQMLCHYCGHTKPFPSPCPSCKSLHFLPMGGGTERLEENLIAPVLQAVPGGKGRILRLDRDSARHPAQIENILTSFARQEAQILVGTQMLSKGHHFPLVTLVIVADADLGLNLPDYRAAERTFQLLVQSSGRAGRGDKHGRVLIQTRNTRHYCWEFVVKGDYDGFYQQEISMRDKRRYPPFVKLALVRASFPANLAEGHSLLNNFALALRESAHKTGALAYGPAPAPLPKVQGRLRYQCLIKADTWPAIRHIFAQAGQRALPQSWPKDWRISLDLDPVNMM